MSDPGFCDGGNPSIATRADLSDGQVYGNRSDDPGNPRF